MRNLLVLGTLLFFASAGLAETESDKARKQIEGMFAEKTGQDDLPLRTAKSGIFRGLEMVKQLEMKGLAGQEHIRKVELERLTTVARELAQGDSNARKLEAIAMMISRDNDDLKKSLAEVEAKELAERNSIARDHNRNIRIKQFELQRKVGKCVLDAQAAAKSADAEKGKLATELEEHKSSLSRIEAIQPSEGSKKQLESDGRIIAQRKHDIHKTETELEALVAAFKGTACDPNRAAPSDDFESCKAGLEIMDANSTKIEARIAQNRADLNKLKNPDFTNPEVKKKAQQFLGLDENSRLDSRAQAAAKTHFAETIKSLESQVEIQQQTVAQYKADRELILYRCV